MTELSLIDVNKSYGDVRVLEGVHRKIADGTFFTLLGPSGCGKTTLLRIVAGFVSPTSGQVRFGSDDMTQVSPHRRGVGMVFQDYALFPDKTVSENVAYGLRARRVAPRDIRTRVSEYLERVGLAGLGDRLPSEMSGGQRQRVALARALVIEPRVLLMDEPLSNLDASLRVQMRDVIRSLQLETRTTTIFVTHDQEEALAMSDEIAVMKNGRIDQCGPPVDVYRNPETAYVADFVGSANLLPAERLGEDAGGLHRFRVLGTQAAGRIMRQSDDGRYLMVARPENLGIRPAAAPDSAPGDGQLSGRVVSMQFQGYRTSYRVALPDGRDLQVEAFGEAGAAKIGRGEEVIVSLGDTCVFVPEADS
ncbi:ATP-binding cassette domain-containing protein [Pseudooceanicola sp. 216_PA32_1]|uniref:ATP-binding cassette domain-containing protein n=1 Tax=Pseudooceanicola pacificus TaxID=2676438 RepID=A0A844W2C0_9RHOB|nr:ABC transporter ATP-binding protein [Pseudooceanicola pacificus]MWB78296.1 ATP-binding cassette domain-containing protein [Pseudooceanicola pacificus]